LALVSFAGAGQLQAPAAQKQPLSALFFMLAKSPVEAVS